MTALGTGLSLRFVSDWDRRITVFPADRALCFMKSIVWPCTCNCIHIQQCMELKQKGNNADTHQCEQNAHSCYMFDNYFWRKLQELPIYIINILYLLLSNHVCINKYTFIGNSHLQVLVLYGVAGGRALQSYTRGFGAWSWWGSRVGLQKCLALWFNSWTRNLH